jgi:hypothetical protein
VIGEEPIEIDSDAAISLELDPSIIVLLAEDDLRRCGGKPCFLKQLSTV